MGIREEIIHLGRSILEKCKERTQTIFKMMYIKNKIIEGRNISALKKKAYNTIFVSESQFRLTVRRKDIDGKN